MRTSKECTSIMYGTEVLPKIKDFDEDAKLSEIYETGARKMELVKYEVYIIRKKDKYSVGIMRLMHNHGTWGDMKESLILISIQRWCTIGGKRYENFYDGNF